MPVTRSNSGRCPARSSPPAARPRTPRRRRRPRAPAGSTPAAPRRSSVGLPRARLILGLEPRQLGLQQRMGEICVAPHAHVGQARNGGFARELRRHRQSIGRGGAAGERERQRQTAKQNELCDPSPTHAERRPLRRRFAPVPRRAMLRQVFACLARGLLRFSAVAGVSLADRSPQRASDTERLQDRHLALQDLARSLRGREPRRAVDFREFLRPPRPRRPLHGERVALELGRIDIALHAPRRRPSWRSIGGKLPSATTSPSSLNPVSSANSRRAAAECVLARLAFALRDAPGAVVLLRPERPARVHQEHLESRRRVPIREECLRFVWACRLRLVHAHCRRPAPWRRARLRPAQKPAHLYRMLRATARHSGNMGHVSGGTSRLTGRQGRYDHQGRDPQLPADGGLRLRRGRRGGRHRFSSTRAASATAR